MARRKRRSKHDQGENKGFKVELSGETKRGVLVVLCFAVAGILFLSLLDLAGQAGMFVDDAAAKMFGWDRFLLPFVAILIGASLTFERVRLSGFNYIGLFFFFLSFNALTNLAAFRLVPPTSHETLAEAGGYVGLFLYQILTAIAGFWGAFVILGALLVVSILLLFNTSLRSIFTVHTHLFGRLTERFHFRRQESGRVIEEADDRAEDDETMAESEEETEEDEEPTTEARPFHKSAVAAPVAAEQVLSSKHPRKMEIPSDLLDSRGTKAAAGDIDRNREVIQKTLQQFGIDVEMADTSVGPTVTQYALHPPVGVKLARIVGLQNDLALALAAHPIRIEAPIPGKSLVGIEVPNQTVAMVALRDLLESKNFKNRDSNMAVALGKDVAGQTWIARLDKMPHLLVAGATGSGKSVCLHTLILSLLYQNGPDDLKFVMVDPKRVELTAYAGIPHMLVPPITKVDETVNALKWAVREMERRLDVLAKFGARDLAGYNAKAEAKIPKLVVIIDELADLMATSRNEVEGLIVRIAQMARAVGIHLVLATQRPSVDVITGLIKANVPARIAFAVASQIDSRTIIDGAGAEKLLGRGDMLYTSAELGKPKRLQGPFVSDEEIERVTKFLRQAGEPDYNYTITQKQKTGTVLDMFNGAEGDSDPMLEEAIHVVIEAGKASTSLLQRRLKLGYARAARVIDMLEDAGVVGPADGAKPREILMTEWPPAGTQMISANEEMMDEAAEEMDEDAAEEEEIVPPAPTEPEEVLVDAEAEEAEDEGGDWFIDETKKA